MKDTLKILMCLLLFGLLLADANASLHRYQFENYIVEYKDTKHPISVGNIPIETGVRISDDAHEVRISPNVTLPCNHSRFYSPCIDAADLVIDLRPKEKITTNVLKPEFLDPMNNTAPNKWAGIEYGKFDQSLGGLPGTVWYLITKSESSDESYSQFEIHGLAQDNGTLVVISSKDIWYPGERNPLDAFNDSVGQLTLKILAEQSEKSVYRSGNFSIEYPGANSLRVDADTDYYLEVDIRTDDTYSRCSNLHVQLDSLGQSFSQPYIESTFEDPVPQTYLDPTFEDPVNNIPPNQLVNYGQYNLSLGGLPGVVKYVITRYDSSYSHDGSSFMTKPMILGVARYNGNFLIITATGDVSPDINQLDRFNESMSHLKLSVKSA
jgi:hypothetical protein